LLFHASHHHAKVKGFNDHRHSGRLQNPDQFFRDLIREPFLNLESPGVNVDNTWNFRKADNLAVRNVGDVRFTIEWQKVVFAKREKLDITDDDEVVRWRGKEGLAHDLIDVFPVAGREKFHCCSISSRRGFEPFTFIVFADQGQDVSYVLGDGGMVRRFLHTQRINQIMAEVKAKTIRIDVGVALWYWWATR